MILGSTGTARDFCAFHAQIIQVNLTSENPQPLVMGSQLEFTYSVRWAPTTISFARRFERYLDYNFFEHQVNDKSGLWSRSFTVQFQVLEKLCSFLFLQLLKLALQLA